MRTLCRFGSTLRGVTLCAWDTLRPKTLFLPQVSHTRATVKPHGAGEPAKRGRMLAAGVPPVKPGPRRMPAALAALRLCLNSELFGMATYANTSSRIRMVAFGDFPFIFEPGKRGSG